MISVKDHGAQGDGTTDDAASIQAAINAANGNDTVYFPATTKGYKVGSTLELTGGTRLLGESRATKLLAAMTDNLIEVSGIKSEISHLGFADFTPLPSSRTGAFIRNWKDPLPPPSSGGFLRISDCYFENGYDHIVGDFVQDLYLVDCSLEGFSHCGVVLGLYGSSYKQSQPGNTYISRCEIVGLPVATAGIYVKQSGGLYISQVDIYGSLTLQGETWIGMQDGINLDPSSALGSIDWTFLDQVQCDSCAHNGLTANGAGVVNGLFCSNSWFSSNRNCGVELGFYDTVSGVQFNGCQAVNNQQAGINLQFHVKQAAITGCLVSGNGDGISFAPGIEDILITGSVVGPFGGFPNSQKHAIVFNGPVSRCVVSSNSLSNNVGGAANVSPPFGVVWSANYDDNDNLALQPTLTPGQAVRNTCGRPVNIYINGGDVDNVLWYPVGGVTAKQPPVTSPATIHLGPWEYVQVDLKPEGKPPTWVWVQE